MRLSDILSQGLSTRQQLYSQLYTLVLHVTDANRTDCHKLFTVSEVLITDISQCTLNVPLLYTFLHIF